MGLLPALTVKLDDCSFPQTPSFLALQGVHSATTAYCHYTQGDSDVISFHIYASWFFTAILWVKLLEMLVTLLSVKYALLVG